MKISEYQDFALRTAKALPIKSQLVHAALGIASESGELANVINAAWMKLYFDPNEIPEEIGDGCWYAALLASLFEWDFKDMFLDPATASDMSVSLAGAVLGRNPVALCMQWTAFAGEIVSCVKSHVIYGKELDVALLEKNLKLFVTTAALLASIHSIPLEHILALNISKLQKRYPEEYSDFNAIERKDKQANIILQ